MEQIGELEITGRNNEGHAADFSLTKLKIETIRSPQIRELLACSQLDPEQERCLHEDLRA